MDVISSTLVGGLDSVTRRRELVNHPNVATVEVVEFLPQVMQWLRDGLVPLSQELTGASDLKLTPGDVYKRLRDDPSQQVDVIVIDVDHSPDDQLGEADHGFYTTEGLSRAKTHLNAGGVMAVWSYAESSAFADAMRTTFETVHVEPIRTINTLVGHEQTDWLFFGKS